MPEWAVYLAIIFFVLWPIASAFSFQRQLKRRAALMRRLRREQGRAEPDPKRTHWHGYMKRVKAERARTE